MSWYGTSLFQRYVNSGVFSEHRLILSEIFSSERLVLGVSHGRRVLALFLCLHKRGTPYVLRSPFLSLSVQGVHSDLFQGLMTQMPHYHWLIGVARWVLPPSSVARGEHDDTKSDSHMTAVYTAFSNCVSLQNPLDDTFPILSLIKTYHAPNQSKNWTLLHHILL